MLPSHPSVLLKLYIYGYLNRVQSSRRLEHEAGRNVEVMWLTGRLAPDHKTIADFRKDNGTAIRKVCARFVALYRTMGLLTQASVAIYGSKFKAVNNRDKNFTRAKMERRMAQIEESVARYLQQLDSADRQEPSEALKTKTSFIDRGAPAPTSRRRLTRANNYLIVESRRPCESVSTRPTVQHIGHPRSATRAATPAPKDSQGCAVCWTMAQASSAAAAAPRIRCAPRKALPNMPTPRK